jgi:hypothetical protein
VFGGSSLLQFPDQHADIKEAVLELSFFDALAPCEVIGFWNSGRRCCQPFPTTTLNPGEPPLIETIKWYHHNKRFPPTF